MSIPHLKARAEFYALCLEHGEDNVEWRMLENSWNNQSQWRLAGDSPKWMVGDEYEFRFRPRTVVIPEAVVPEEDPEGEYCFGVITWRRADGGLAVDNPDSRKSYMYRTAADRDAVVAAMLKREVKR